MTIEQAAVELSGLSKSYGQVHAVRDLDLSVAAGEIVAVSAPTGRASRR